MQQPDPLTFAGLLLDRPRLMGIVNVTPDSFSDGGLFLDPDAAIAQGLKLIEDGADILDVGGESTRPGSDPVPVEEEIRRVVPVIEGLAKAGALVSVDTRRAAVMRAAIEAGAKIVNDISALTGDPDSVAVCADADIDVVLMHMRGEPKTMQHKPVYEDVVADIHEYFQQRIATLDEAGIDTGRIAVDPGIGFGKTVEHNLTLISHIDAFHSLGTPIVLGVSRKTFIAKVDRDVPPPQRVAGSLATAIAGWDRGAQIIRVHDVAETRQALAIWQAIEGADELA